MKYQLNICCFIIKYSTFKTLEKVIYIGKNIISRIRPILAEIMPKSMYQLTTNQKFSANTHTGDECCFPPVRVTSEIFISDVIVVLVWYILVQLYCPFKLLS